MDSRSGPFDPFIRIDFGRIPLKIDTMSCQSNDA